MQLLGFLLSFFDGRGIKIIERIYMQLELFWEHFNYPNVTPIYYYWEELPLKLYEELEEIERINYERN